MGTTNRPGAAQLPRLGSGRYVNPLQYGWCEMRTVDPGFDIDRYRRLLAEANDEASRLALIDLLIEENARDRLAAADAHRQAMQQAEAIRRLIEHPGY